MSGRKQQGARLAVARQSPRLHRDLERNRPLRALEVFRTGAVRLPAQAEVRRAHEVTQSRNRRVQCDQKGGRESLLRTRNRKQEGGLAQHREHQPFPDLPTRAAVQIQK